MYRFKIDDTNDSYDIFVNLISSPAGRYLSRRPYLIAILKDLLSSKQLRGDRIVIEKDLGHNIGKTDVIDTKDDDAIYYAQALKSDVFSRFARNRFPQNSSILSVILIRDDDGNYEINDIWIGANYPAFPGAEEETAESRTYWQTHALVHDALVIQSKSITKICPY